MPVRLKSNAAKWVVVCLVSTVASVATAGLKEKPPKGVALTGLWRIDPYRSDDPDAVLSQARAEADKTSDSSGGSGRGNRGGFGRGGGGFPGGEGGGGGGGRGHGGHRPSSDSSSTPDEESSTHTPPRAQLLKDLAANPATLDFSSTEHTVKVSAEQSDTECAAGVKVAILDAAGAAERNCGWDGRAWVIDTERGKTLKRTDRFELSQDGKTLTYITTASGQRLPKIKISRTYIAAF